MLNDFYTRLVRPILLVLAIGAVLLYLVKGASVNAPEPPVTEVEELAPDPVETPDPVAVEPVIEEPEIVLLTCAVEYEPIIVEATKPAEMELPSTGEPEPSYTDEELDMLALVIYQEAGADDCSDDTRLKVGTVVMNRVADDDFPDTIYEVITQEAQYGRLHWTGPVWPERASTEQEAHAVKRAYDCAERILQGERFLPEDVIWQAEFVQGTEIVSHQDGFYFCK